MFMKEIVYKVRKINGKRIAIHTIDWQAKMDKVFESLGNPNVQKAIGITIVLTQLYLDSKDPTY